MCGIIVYSKRFAYPIEKALLDLRHRGPDKSNYFSDEELFMGHTLLQIRGNLRDSIQPKVSKNGRYIILYNGEIYNFNYIKKFIKIENNKLDTSYVIKLLDKFGVKGLSYIDGMYAIVIYDKQEKKLIFTRDSSGQKNLYYYINNDGKIIVSSEITPILNIRNKENHLSIIAFQEFFSTGLNPNQNTIIDNIHKLLPGEIIFYSLEKKSIEKFFLEKLFAPIGNLSSKNLIKNNILSHLPSIKKIALNLSGGIDSNLILNEVIKLNKKIDVFSTFCESDDKNFNSDFFIAKKLAKKYNLNFIETYVSKKNYFENIIKVNEIIEEPNRNPASTLYFLNLKNQAEKGYRTILTGSGGDEVFIGYNIFFFNRQYQEILNKIYSMTNSETIYKFLIYSLIDHSGKYCLPRFFLNKDNYYLKYKFASFLTNKIFDFQKILFNLKKFYSLNFLKLIYGQYTWLANESYLTIDKLSMNNSIEMRAPFSSHEFSFKQMNFLEEKHFISPHNKPTIRESYKDDLDEIVINNKKKTGWPIPREWLLSKEFRDLILDFIPKSDDSLFRFARIRNHIEKYPKNLNKNYFYSLLSFLILSKKYKIQY
jgi:asparagine synthase (glutamine-hydrolysing)